MITLAFFTVLYDQDRNDGKARLRQKQKTSNNISGTFISKNTKNIPTMIIANINNIPCMDFIVSGKKKMFWCVDDDLRTDINSMMQTAPSLP